MDRSWVRRERKSQEEKMGDERGTDLKEEILREYQLLIQSFSRLGGEAILKILYCLAKEA